MSTCMRLFLHLLPDRGAACRHESGLGASQQRVFGLPLTDKTNQMRPMRRTQVSICLLASNKNMLW